MDAPKFGGLALSPRLLWRNPVAHRLCVSLILCVWNVGHSFRIVPARFVEQRVAWVCRTASTHSNHTDTDVSLCAELLRNDLCRSNTAWVSPLFPDPSCCIIDISWVLERQCSQLDVGLVALLRCRRWTVTSYRKIWRYTRGSMRAPLRLWHPAASKQHA